MQNLLHAALTKETKLQHPNQIVSTSPSNMAWSETIHEFMLKGCKPKGPKNKSNSLEVNLAEGRGVKLLPPRNQGKIAARCTSRKIVCASSVPMPPASLPGAISFGRLTPQKALIGVGIVHSADAARNFHCTLVRKTLQH